MKCKIIPLFILLCVSARLFAQEKYQLEELFYDAQSWFFYEEYEDALPIYLRLNKILVDNDNINYKIGMCYLNIPGEKTKSIPYLEKASKNTTRLYNKDSFLEKKAPMEAVFYLGNAYLINNQIDKAKKYYEKFKKLIQKDIYDMSYVNRQVVSCNNAIIVEDKPINYLAYNLGSKINSRFSDFNPVVSGDESSLVYNSRLKFYDAVFWSTKVNGEWTAPVNIIPQLGIDDKCYCTSVSFDGKELYLYKIDDFDGNIYVSNLKDGRWSNVKKLNENINTKYWESHASISTDGKKLYFTSNRKGGIGDLDIYVSERDSLNNWGTPQNIGSTINTPYNENTPFITENGSILFFSSEGHNTIGGYDIFYSVLENKEWTSPVNIGYPINTTDDNTFFLPLQNGQIAYYADFSNQGYGSMDIYRLKMISLESLGHINIDATLTLKDNISREVEDFSITVTDTLQDDTIAILHPNTDKNNYTYKTLSGKNHLIFETNKTEENTMPLFISKGYDIKEVILNPSLASNQDEHGVDEDSIPEGFNYKIPDNNNVKIKLLIDNQKNLLVETYVEGTKINSETFIFEGGVFIYDYKPSEGKSTIKLKQISQDNKIKNKDFTVSYIPEGLPENAIKRILAEKKLYSLTGENKVLIKLSLQNGGDLTVETYINDKALKAKKFIIGNNLFSYEYSPAENILIAKVDTIFNISGSEEQLTFDSAQAKLINNYISQLNTISEGNVKEIFKKIITDTVKFKTKEELVKYLIAHTETYAYKPIDLVLPLVAAEISKSTEIDQLINDLILLSDGGLKEALENIKSGSIDISNIAQLIKYLNENTTNFNYTNNDVTNLLLMYALNKEKDINKLVNKLLKVTDGELHQFLTRINIKRETISTPYELVNYLLHKTNSNTFTEADVLIAVLKLTTLEEEIKTSVEDHIVIEKGIPSYYWWLLIIIILATAWIIIKYMEKKKKKKDTPFN